MTDPERWPGSVDYPGGRLPFVGFTVNERTGLLQFRMDVPGGVPQIAAITEGYGYEAAANRPVSTAFGHERLADVEAWLEHCLEQVRLVRSGVEPGVLYAGRWFPPN